MKRRRFVVASTVSLVVITAAIAGLAYYSDFVAKAFVQGVPGSIQYLPADTKVVFGVNVQKFLRSSVYADIMLKHGQEIGTNLSEFTTMTGVNPQRDVDYIIGAGRSTQIKGSGVVIAVGRFNPVTITNFINTKVTPVKVDYAGATVLMIPETNRLQKGIAFLSNEEVAIGDLESLKAVLDVRGGTSGIRSNATMNDLLGRVSPEEMFWFAGDASLLANVPATNQFATTLTAIQSVFGTLNLDSTISGKVSVVARDATAAGQLADFARGLVALGNLASGQNPALADVARGVQITQSASQFDITITLPYEILQKLEASKGKFGVDAPLNIK